MKRLRKKVAREGSKVAQEIKGKKSSSKACDENCLSILYILSALCRKKADLLKFKKRICFLLTIFVFCFSYKQII